MNAPMAVREATEVPEYQGDETSTTALVLNPNSMKAMMEAANMMASSKVTIPAHLRGNAGDCMAVVIQSMQWGMNPFAIAQKTHLTQGGQLGYEAQLISAVVTAKAIQGAPEYEFIGDWSKILGKVAEREGKNGGKYYVGTWNAKDEEGLGVTCRARLRGEAEPREITVMMSQCYPRFSTQWATDPQQQITYVAIRKWSRRYAPGAILGVYSTDELEDEQPQGGERVLNPTEADKQQAQKKEQKAFPADSFKRNLEKWRREGTLSPEDFIATLSSRGVLSEDQKAEIRKGRVIDGEATTTTGSAPSVTFAQVEDKLRKAEDLDLLDIAADFIREVQNPDHRAELQALYESRRAEMTK